MNKYKIDPNVIKTEDDLYFRIANLLLSKESGERITVDDINTEIKDRYEVKLNGDLSLFIKHSINALVESGKYEEGSRWYERVMDKDQQTRDVNDERETI